MRITQDNIKIELENEGEIMDFWNVISFALDLHCERQKKGESCMTDDEYKMARKLQSLTEKKW